MVNISQTFITYHGCYNGYQDGTRKVVPKNRKSIKPTYNPFQKKPIDVRNKAETRGKLITKPKLTIGYMKRYMKYSNVF